LVHLQVWQAVVPLSGQAAVLLRDQDAAGHGSLDGQLEGDAIVTRGHGSGYADAKGNLDW